MSASRIATQISASGMRHVTLVRDRGDVEDDATATAELLAAIDAFALGWLEPIAVAFLIDCCDPADAMWPSPTPPAQPSWVVRAEGLPDDVDMESPFGKPEVMVEPVVNAAAITRAVARATSQRCEGAHVAALGLLWWTSVRARLPIDDDVTVKDGRYEIASRIERTKHERWAVGPIRGGAPTPISVKARNHHSLLTISLAVHWTIWIDHPERVDEAIARVLARPGWEAEQP